MNLRAGAGPVGDRFGTPVDYCLSEMGRNGRRFVVGGERGRGERGPVSHLVSSRAAGDDTPGSLETSPRSVGRTLPAVGTGVSQNGLFTPYNITLRLFVHLISTFKSTVISGTLCEPCEVCKTPVFTPDE